jgi:hypothetical protein
METHSCSMAWSTSTKNSLPTSLMATIQAERWSTSIKHTRFHLKKDSAKHAGIILFSSRMHVGMSFALHAGYRTCHPAIQTQPHPNKSFFVDALNRGVINSSTTSSLNFAGWLVLLWGGCSQICCQSSIARKALIWWFAQTWDVVRSLISLISMALKYLVCVVWKYANIVEKDRTTPSNALIWRCGTTLRKLEWNYYGKIIKIKSCF